MASVYIKADYMSLKKPFCLSVREHNLGGVEWGAICRLDLFDARLLAGDTNIPWWNGEPDWEDHFKKIARMEAEQDLRNAQGRLATLEATP